MKILLHYRRDFHNGQLVQTYAECVRCEFLEKGHEVFTIGEGHDYQIPGSPFPANFEILNTKHFDLLLELDNGRSPNGQFIYDRYDKVNVPRAVWFIDSHGQPDLHRRLAKGYDHVFFAVYNRRDLFANHKSAHWLPNATDPVAFARATNIPEIQFGFFGSKGGLDRAYNLRAIAEKHGFTYDIRQVNGAWKPRWPFTAEAMSNCQILFNHGQKHDGPNLRVMESMAVGRPLITDVDPLSGMDKLFVEGRHYLGYEAYTFNGLEEKMLFAINNPDVCKQMADEAYNLVMSKHLITHRVDSMLEVFNGK